MVAPNHSPDPHRGAWIEALGVFAMVAAAYVALATWTMLGHNLVMGDAISRLANASYALRGRDPHLEAIGFVWNPLPTLVMTVVSPFRSLWEPLGNPGLASGWTSALFMAATVAATGWTLRTWGFERRARLLGAAMLATNPLIVFYAVNGMSEAFFLFFLVLAVGGLAGWLTRGSSLSLVGAATALGVCYLVRYEAVAAAGAAAACVAAVSFVTRFRQNRDTAVSEAIGNSSVLVLPIAFTFGAFALASWLITGAAFEQFTSQYGNAAVLASAGGHTTLGARGLFAIGELTGAAPLLIPVAIIVLITARGVWGRRAMAAVAVFGGVLVLSALLQASGSTLGSVLVDVLDGFPLVLASRNPAQFVIPSDRDFALVLGDPMGHGVRYLLTVPPTGRGTVDAVNQRFPGIYDSGANIATVELQADQDGSNTGWRLYKLWATAPPP